jgi:hypothetical protein
MLIRAFGCNACLVAILFFACVGVAGQADATRDEPQSLQEQIARLQQEIKDTNDRNAAKLKDLQDQVDSLKQKAAEASEPAAAPEPNQTPSQAGPPARIGQGFNPDISAIGDVLFHSGKNEEGENKNQFSFRELELALGSAVDPFGRADFFVALEEEAEGEFAVDLEEGYFTFDTLPHDLKARVGKFYSFFGKANQFHTHAMPWVDHPLMIRNFFGEEGMSEPGAELSWLVPNPWEKYIELIFQIQDNRNARSFADGQSRGLMYVGHLKNFFDMTHDSSLEVGGSVATGANAATGDEHWTNLEGLDVTYKWRPAQQGLYRSLTWMNELLLSQKEQGDADTVDSFGGYSSLEYQFTRRGSAFGRYDYSQFPDDNDSHENAYTGGLTFAQSEFAFWRVQFTHTEGDGPSTVGSRNEFFLQLDFGIGPHRAHQY